MPDVFLPPRLVIFDCDGVLVDSEPVSNACLAAALAEEGLQLTVAETRQRYVGLSMASAVARIEAELGRPLPRGWLDRLQAETFERLRQEVKPVAGVEAAVRAIEAAGVAVCVASSGAPEKMAVTLGTTGLSGLFDGRLFSSHGMARGKPFPDLFLHAAAAMGVTPSQAVVIEDSLPGVQAAVAAGMGVFGYVGDPMTDRAGLAGAGATVFESMRDLPQLLGIGRSTTSAPAP